MKTVLKNNFFLTLALMAIMFVLAACGGMSDSEVKEAVDAAAVAAAEQAVANMPTATPASTPVPVDTAAIAAQVVALMPTPVPTPTVAPTPTQTPEALMAQEVVVTPESAITPTPDVTVPTIATSVATLTISSTVVLTPSFLLELDGFDGPITFSGWAPRDLSANGDWYDQFTASDTWESIAQTWKSASQGCSLPGACNIFSPSGVLGADDYDEAMANESAVWTGSMWHDSPDQNGYDMLCPEGSYCDTFAHHFGSVSIGDPDNPFIHFSIPGCGSNCGQGLTIRNWLSREGVDLNTNVHIEDYGAPSAASWTEYNVPPSAAEYMSEGYLTDRVVNGHSHNVNGSGPEDNYVHYHWTIDLNDMSIWLMRHTAEDGWVLIWTNVQDYGTH